MKKVRIYITANDIMLGVRGHGLQCPLARAISRRLGKEIRVLTYAWYRLDDYTSPNPYPLPLRATQFVKAFDGGRKVAPFSFTLEVPNGRR
jgi:hypothetical protein